MMDYKTIIENWKKFAQQPKPRMLNERREIMNEVSQAVTDRIYDWMRTTEGLSYDFKEIFGDAMRITFPMDSSDTRTIKQIVEAIRQEGWIMPIGQSERSSYEDHLIQQTGNEPTKEQWAEWERHIRSTSRWFPKKKVKQKRQRLAADGGGEYEIEIEVADLTLERAVDMVIPKGPRAGEKITKVHKQGINKIIAGLEKKGKIPAGSSQWWAKNQTHYTKDNNARTIERGLRDSVNTDDHHIILSRHPIDVLRMSDIGNIQSCHSEGSSHFQCAVAEAKGHGPIAYLVTQAELNKLLKPSEEREKPIAKIDRMFSDMAKGERITAIRQDYDTESPEGALVLLWAWARSNVGRKWMEEYKKKAEMAAKPERHQELMMISQSRQLNIGPELFKQYIKNYEKYVARGTGSHPDNWKPWEDITSEEEYKAALEKHSEEATRAPDPRDLGDLDDEEIFRDNDREIPGIAAISRVRLRKYIDSENDLTFAAPESRVYGKGVAGFVAAVAEKAWDLQKGMFAQELGDKSGEWTTYFVPDVSDLTRRGGTYGDTQDGEILNNLFKRAGDAYKDRFSDYIDVHHEGEDEEDENEHLWDEYSEQIEEMEQAYNNSLEHCSVYATVDGDEEPYVHGGGEMIMEIPLGFKGPVVQDHGSYNYHSEEADYSVIPAGYSHDNYEDFRDKRLDLPNEYPEDIEWEVEGDAGEEAILKITYRFNCEDCGTPDDFDGFCDYMTDLDGNYDKFYMAVRKKLVEGEYAKPSAWDNTQNEINDFEDRLKHFNIIGDDDDNPTGEVWFNLGRGTANGDPEIPLELDLPVREMYWLSKHPNVFGGARSPRQIDAPGLMAKALSGRRERNVVWVGPDTNSSFARFFSEKLKKLEAAANSYAATQLDLPFGDKYAAPAFEGVSFAKDLRLGLKFGEAEHQESAKLPIYFRLRIVSRSVDSKEELEGAFHFVEFVDNHYDMVMQAAKEVTQGFVIDPNLEIAQEYKKEYLGGNVAMEASKKIMDDFVYDSSQMNSHTKAIVEWWSSDNVFSKMNEFEKEVLIEKYLKPLSNGAVHRWNTADDLPDGWSRNVQAWMQDAGVASAIGNKYNGEEIKSPEITEKHFGTADEREAKRKEQDIEMYVKRQAREMGREMTPEEIQAIRDTYKEPDNPVKRPTLPGTLRGTLGAPRPAEGIDRRITRLQKALTEAKIRAKIMNILRTE
jgi:hypothetical protein